MLRVFDLNKLEIFLIFLLPISIVIGNFIANVIILLIIIISTISFINDGKKLSKFFCYFSILLISLLLINLYFSSHKDLSLRAILGLIKHFLLFLSLCFLFKKNLKNFNYFIASIFFLILFVSIDTTIQYFFDRDIFGFEPQISHGKRLSGPFGDEYVVGAFLSKLLFISLFYFHLYKIRFSKIILYFYILFVFTVIFFSKERAAFYLTGISLVIFLVMSNLKNKKIIFYNLIGIISLLSIFLVLNEQARLKYLLKPVYYLGFKNIEFVNTNITYIASKYGDNINYVKDHSDKSLLDTRHGAHFLTAFEITKNNFFLGSGLKTFRHVCQNSEYENIKSQSANIRCNTHPHQIYLEIISEGGIFIFIIFLFIIIFYVKKIYNSKSINYTEKILLICSLIILFFPLQTSGSFFSTFNGFFYWILISIMTYKLNIKIFKD